ncbi:MAG: hypothetical protein OEV06_09810 [Anaerolineae bacterium]|nr:hypothetical protein [Anaerolineae bacterium]
MKEISILKLAWFWIWRSLLGALVGLLLIIIWYLFSILIFRNFLDIPFDEFGIAINLDQTMIDSYVRIFALAISFPIGLAIYVYCKSNFQVRVFQRILGEEDELVQWADQSAYGAFFGATILVSLNYLMDDIDLPYFLLPLPNAAFVLIMAIFQWRILRKYFSEAYIWFVIAVMVMSLHWINLELSEALFSMDSLTPILFSAFIVWPLMALLIQTFGIVLLSKTSMSDPDPY